MNAIRRDDGTIVVKGGYWEVARWASILAVLLGYWYRSETKAEVRFNTVETRQSSNTATIQKLTEAVERLKENKTDIEVVKQRLEEGERRFDGVDRSLNRVNVRLDEISRQVRNGG